MCDIVKIYKHCNIKYACKRNMFFINMSHISNAMINSYIYIYIYIYIYDKVHFVTSSIVHVDVLELMRELFANLNVVNTVNIAKHK